MKKFWERNYLIVLLFVAWKLVLTGIEYIAPSLLSLQQDFMSPVHWANFDGLHYLSIAKEGYRQYLQAFFPVYPLMIANISVLFPYLDTVFVALFISHVSFFFGLMLFYRLIERESPERAQWSLIFLLFFPTSFFFAGVYTTSLFFLFAVAMMYAAQARRYLLAGILGTLASATQLFGVFLGIFLLRQYVREQTKVARIRVLLGMLLVPVGLIAYMTYLAYSVGDPLAFVHVQPAFGANRTGGEIVLLPQVLWRYIKIIGTVPLLSFPWVVAMFELASFSFGLFIIYMGWRSGIDWSYLVYSLAVLILPSLTGTLSSVPRYLLSAFPLLYILAASLREKWRYRLMVLFVVLLLFFESAFLQGFFVS